MKSDIHASSSILGIILVAGCVMLVGCGVFQGRQSPGSYEGGKSDSWTGHKQAPWPMKPAYQTVYPVLIQDTNGNVLPMPLAPMPTNTSIMPPMPVVTISPSKIDRKLTVSAPDPMAPVSYKPMSAVITPKLPACPPLHWEASNGWGGIVISGPVLSVLDWNHTGCPQYPNTCTVRAWLTETTDYILPVQTSGQEFAKIIPFETE